MGKNLSEKKRLNHVEYFSSFNDASVLLTGYTQCFKFTQIVSFILVVGRLPEKPTENSKTRTEPKPKITDFSKTEPNRNRIQKPRLTEKGHF